MPFEQQTADKNEGSGHLEAISFDKTEIEKTADKYTLADLADKKTSLKTSLEAKIKHPGVLEGAYKELDEKLGPIEQQLNKLQDEKNINIAAVKTEVERVATEVLNKQRTFTDITAEGVKFTYGSPVQHEQYEAILAEASTTVRVFQAYGQEAAKEGKMEPSIPTAGADSRLECKVQLNESAARGLNFPLDTFKIVSIKGDKVTETFSNKQLENEKQRADAFSEAFEKWKKGDPPEAKFIYEYGDPKQTQTVDLSYFNFISRTDVKIDHIKQYISDVNDHTITDEPYFDKDGKMKTEYANLLDKTGALKLPPLFKENFQNATSVTKTVQLDGKGKMKVLSESIVNQDIADKESKTTVFKEYDSDGNLIREITSAKVERNQKIRDSKTIVEYWPGAAGEKGEKPKIKKIEQYEDDEIVQKTVYNERGELKKETITVMGCPNIVGETQLMTFTLPNGKTMEGYGTVMKIKDGDKTVDVPNFTIWRLQHPEYLEKTGQGQDKKAQGFEEYKKFLASVLVKDGKPDYQRIHAFSNIMFSYVEDSKIGDRADRITDPLSMTYSTEIGFVRKSPRFSKMLGDCEDYAFFLRDVLKAGDLQPPARVLYLPGHAEAIYVFQDKQDKYHAASFGTFGCQIDKNQVGKDFDTSKALKGSGYNTPHEAMEALQAKWHCRISGQPSMRDGALMHGEIEVTQKAGGKPGEVETKDLRLVTEMHSAYSKAEVEKLLGGEIIKKSQKQKDGDALFVYVYGKDNSYAKIFLDSQNNEQYSGYPIAVYTSEWPYDLVKKTPKVTA